MVQTIGIEKFNELLQEGAEIVDLRTPIEFSSGRIPNAINIDYYNPSYKKEIAKLNKSKTYLIYCHSGGRSLSALDDFESLGFEEVYNLRDGILSWIQSGFIVEK